MSLPRPPFLMWMKRKIARAKPGLANLAVSGVATEYANRWQQDVLTNRAAEIVERSGESNQFGLESLKQAIRRAYRLPEDREIVTSLGASGGYRLVCEILLAGRPDAEIVIESPVYEPLRAIPERLGAKLILVSRSNDMADLVRAVTNNTVAVVLSNLHNPTGHWLGFEQLEQLADALESKKTQAFLVVDETFLDIGPQPATTAAVVHRRIITVSSLSKSHGLPALRCGWVTADLGVLPDFVDDAVLFQNIGGKLAEVLGAMAVEEINEFRRAAWQHLDGNRKLVGDWLRESADRGLIEAQDLPPGCIVFPRVCQSQPTWKIVDDWEERFGVLVVPGRFFGDEYDDRIRIGFGGERDNVKRGLSRLTSALETAL